MVGFGGGRGSPAAVPLVIVGAGGHGREVLDIVEALHPAYAVVGFLADDPADADALARRGQQVLGPVAAAGDHGGPVALGVGLSHAREAVAGRIAVPVVSLVHPAAVVDRGSVDAAGPGLVVAAGASLGAGVRLGAHVHLNVNATVAGGASLDDFVTVSPGAVVREGVRLDRAAFVGAGAVVAPGVRVGAHAVVGAGAEVGSDVPPGGRVVGRPAR